MGEGGRAKSTMAIKTSIYEGVRLGKRGGDWFELVLDVRTPLPPPSTNFFICSSSPQ